MASGQSPQRSRKSQPLPGPNIHGPSQLREASPSPNLAKAQRSMRTQSMPLVPSVMQMFNNGSPTQRLLPTPPHADDSHPSTMKRGQSGGGGSPAQPQPRANDVASRQFLAKFKALDANYELTEQLLKEVEASGEVQGRPNLHTNASAPATFDEGMRRDFHASILLNNVQRSSSPAFLSPLGERPPPFASPRTQGQPINPNPNPNTIRSPRSPQDRSLPVQEEDGEGDDDFHEHLAGSPVPSSDLHPEDKPLPTSSSSEEGDGSFTPRSPVSSLPANHPNNHIYIQQLARGRGGAMDRVQLQGLDAAMLDSQSQDGDLGPNAEEMAMAAQQYLDEYFHHYYANTSRPDAPIPPTPPSQATPSPYPQVAGSPYPYPFTDFRRPIRPPSTLAPTPSQAAEPTQALDPASIHSSLVRQWQIYASNRAYEDMQSEVSTLSPAASPANGGPERFNPWAQWHASKIMGRSRWGAQPGDLRSIQSSPSHEPVVQRTFPRAGTGRKKRSGSGGSGSGLKEGRTHSVKRKPPPRVASTQPRDTSPEPSSSGEDTGDDTSVIHEYPEPESTEDTEGPQFAIVEEGKWVSNGGRSRSASKGPSPVLIEDVDEEDEWVDEDDSDGDDLLALEYHPSFVRSVEKRRKRFDVKWEALVEAFQALDRQTDTTMILLAAPNHSTKLHSISSRSIKRASPSPAALPQVKSTFSNLATHLKSKRPPSTTSLTSDTSTLNNEQDLRRALEAALGSLTALGGMWDEREMRWKDEMKRASEERERVEGLLRGVLGGGRGD